MKNTQTNNTLRGETAEVSPWPPQAQQQGNLSSEAFEEIPLLAVGSVEQLEGVASLEGNGTQATDNEIRASIGTPHDTTDALEKPVVGDEPLAAASSLETSSSSTETGPWPRDEKHVQQVSRADGAEGSSKVAHTAVSSESDSVHPPSEQPPQGESAGGDCEIRLPNTEGSGGWSPEDGGTGRRRSDMMDSTTPRLGELETGEDSSGQFAAPHDEDQPAGQPVCVPAVHTTSTESAMGSNDLQPLTGHEPPQHTSSCDSSSGVNPAADEFHTRSSRDDGLARALLVSSDARKLADEVISSSLVTVAAVVSAISRDRHYQPGHGAEMIQVPIQESSQGLPPVEQIDLRNEADRRSPAESTEESARFLSSSPRTTVVNSFLAGVFEIVSALGAAAAAKVPPPAVEEMPKNTVDSATVIVQQQSVPIEHEATDKPDQLDSTEQILVPPVSGSSASEKTFSVGIERTTAGGSAAEDAGSDDEKPAVVPLDGQPSPPSSASLRAAVIQDFVSDAYGTIASDAAAPVVEIPSDLAPAPKTMSEEPPPTEDEPADCTIQLDQTGDNVSPVPSTSETESLVGLATGVGDERPPIDVEERVHREMEDVKPIGVGPSDGAPGPPSSASLRAAVVQDFVSDTYEAIASDAVAPVVEIPPDMAPVPNTLSEEPRTTGDETADRTIQLDQTGDNIEPVTNASASEAESPVELATVDGDERPPIHVEERVDDEMEDDKATGVGPSEGQPSPPSSASLRAAVVQDFVSDTCGIIASEAAAQAVEVPPALEIPPDMAPAPNTLSEESPPMGDETPDRTTQLYNAEDNVEPVTNASASENESPMELVTVDGDERPPIGVEEMVDDEPTGVMPSDGQPSPPSSASLRAAVVQDFVSDTCGTIASEAAAQVVEVPLALEIPPDMAPAPNTLSEEPPPIGDKTPDRTIHLDQTGDSVLPVLSTSEAEPPVELATGVGDEGPPIGAGEMADDKPTEVGPSDDQPSPPSSASLRAAVVQDFVSDTYGTIASDAVAPVVEIPPDMAPPPNTLSEEPPPMGDETTDCTTQLDKAEGSASPLINASASEAESPAELVTDVGDERPPIGAGEMVDDKPAGVVPSDGQPSPSSLASLRAAVVQDFVSDTYGAIASDAVAPVVEIPPDLAPATKTASQEPPPMGDETADRTIQLDKAEDSASPLINASASENESPVELATVVGDERPPIGDDDIADGKERIRDAPDSPSPPSSPSVRGAVVADFLSGAYRIVTTTEACAAVAAPSAPGEHASSAPAPTADPALVVVELDTPRERTEPSLAVLDTRRSEQLQRPEQHTTTVEQLGSEAAKEEGQHPARSSSTSPPLLLLSEESLHVAVVEAYLSATLSGILSAEVGAEAATGSAERSQATPGEPPARHPGGAARTAVAAGNVQDSTETIRQDAAAISAARSSSIVQAMDADEHRSTSLGDACTSDGEARGAEARDRPRSPTPPGTPEDQRHGNADPALEPGVPTEPNRVDVGHPPNPRSVEALVYLAEAGARAKSLEEASERARGEAAEWLALTGDTAKTARDTADKDRADASSWLRDTGTRALSLKGKGTSQEEAAEWLCDIGRRVKSAQGRADKARADASSWLGDKGCRALSLESREQAGRLECANWLRLAGGRAKSAQARAEIARSEAVSWLRDTGGRAVSQQERAAGERSDAAAWLVTNGSSGLERTTPTEGSATAAAAAAAAATATTHLQGDLDGERVGGCNSLGAEDVGKTPAKGDEKLRAEGSTTQGGSQPGPPAASGSPRTDRLSSATVTEDVRAAETDGDTVQHSPRNDEGAEERLAGDNGEATAVAPTADAPPLPCRSTSSAENGADATAAAAAAAAAADADGDFEYPVGRTASTDRTAPAPWLEPAATPLARGGSFAPTAAGAEDFGRMLDAGEAEWSRVSLSRTPPFDALNSPSLPQRYAPVRGRPRPLPQSDSEGFDAGATFASVNGAPAGAASNPDGSAWMEFFAPPNQMAPKGDAYRGSDSFHSADASASTTVRADSAGSFIGPAYCCASGGTTDHNDYVDGSSRAWQCSGGGATSEESWGGSLGEVRSPVGEAQSRIMCRAAGEEGRGGGRWEESPEVSSTSSGSVRADGEGSSSRKQWHEKAEQSRRYMRRWETFLGRAHRHFDGEADVRKRMSVVRRAHPDVSNEVAFVALAQSRGRSSEAAAVLHLPRAKDEAALVAMMLDVASFVALARETAERRRRSRQLEKHRRMAAAARGPPHRGSKEERPPHPSEQQQQQQQQQQQYHQCYGHEQPQQSPAWPGADPSSHFEGVDADAAGRIVGAAGNGRCQQQHHYHQHPRPLTKSGGGSRGELQSRRSDSAPSLLPPIEGRLTLGTPPSPCTLRAVLSTSRSVAVEVPLGFGLVPEAGRAPNGDERFQALDPKSARRDLRAMLRARAQWQRQRMAEMAVPGAQQQRQGGGSGLDAVTERFLRETRALDRDSEHLDDRLRGRWQRKKKRRHGGWRDHNQHGQSGGAAAAGSTGGGSNSSSTGAWRGGGGGGGRSMFLASLNSNTRAPFPLSGADEGRGGGISSRNSLSTAAAATAAASIQAAAGGDGGGCRVQSYFTQALGDGSLCGARDK